MTYGIVAMVVKSRNLPRGRFCSLGELAPPHRGREVARRRLAAKELDPRARHEGDARGSDVTLRGPRQVRPSKRRNNVTRQQTLWDNI